LFNGAVSWKDGFQGHKFSQDAARRPYIDLAAIRSRIQDKFGCPIVPGTDIGDIVFFLFYYLGRPEITDF
jgi:hypothetical protein